MVRRHKNLVEQRIEAQREEQLKRNGRVSRITQKQDIKEILKLKREEDISKSKEFSFVVKESSRIDNELKKIPFKTLQEAKNFISKLDPKIKERITTNPQKQFDNQLKVLEERVTTTKKRIASSLEDEREASSKSREDKAEARTKGYEKELIELNKIVTGVKSNNSFIDTKKAIDFADEVGDNEFKFQKDRKEISRKKKEAKSKSLKLITAKAKTQILSTPKTTTQPKQLTALDKTIANNLAKRLRAGETLSATHQKQATKLLGSDNVKEFSNVGKIIKDIDKGNFKVAFRDLEKKGIKDPRLKEFVIAKASNEFDIKKFKDLDTTKFFLGTQQVSGLNKAKTDLKQSLGQQTSFSGYQNTYNQIKLVDNELKNRKGNLRAFDTNTFNVAVNILNNQIKKRQVQTQQVRNINATIIRDFKNSGVINKEVAQAFINANNDKQINPQAVTGFLVAAGKQKGSLKDLEKLKKDVKDNSFLQFLSKIGKVAATPDTKNVKSSIKFFKEAEVNPAFKKNPFNKEVNAKLLKSLKDFPNQTENILNAHFNFISKATLGIGKGLIIDFAGGTIKSLYELGKDSVKLGGYLAKKTRESTIKETSRLKKNPKLRDEKAKLVKEYFTNAASINNFNDLKNNFNPKESKLKESAIVNHPKRAIELLAVMSLATGYSFTNAILSKMIKKTKAQPYRTLGLVIGEVATTFTPTKVVRGINLLEKGLRVVGSKVERLIFSVDEFSKLQKLALSIGKKTSKLTRAEKDTLQVYKIQKELKFLTSPQSELRKVESTITKVKTGKKITAKETRLLNTFEDNLNSSLIKLEKKQNKIINNKKALTTLFTKLEKADPIKKKETILKVTVTKGDFIDSNKNNLDKLTKFLNDNINTNLFGKLKKKVEKVTGKKVLVRVTKEKLITVRGGKTKVTQLRKVKIVDKKFKVQTKKKFKEKRIDVKEELKILNPKEVEKQSKQIDLDLSQGRIKEVERKVNIGFFNNKKGALTYQKSFRNVKKSFKNTIQDVKDISRTIKTESKKLFKQFKTGKTKKSKKRALPKFLSKQIKKSNQATKLTKEQLKDLKKIILLLKSSKNIQAITQTILNEQLKDVESLSKTLQDNKQELTNELKSFFKSESKSTTKKKVSKKTTPKKTTTSKKITKVSLTKITKPIKARKFKTTKRIIDEEIIKIKKLPKLDPESKNKLLVNRILIVEGRYRERINPRLPASKKNKVIPKTLKLKTTMNRALKELGELADRKAIRSIEPRVLGITNKKVQDIKRPAILHKFNIRKTKKALILVEQSKFALDSKTEQNELRILKKKKKQAFKPKKKTSIKSKSKTKKKTTPKKKTTHPTASSGTKKKKKGSPQKKAKKGKSKKKTSSKNKTKKFNQVKTTKKSIKLNFKTKTGKKVSFKATKIIKKKKKSLKTKKK